MLEKRVSIVITNYDYARFLGRSIESALSQTHPNVEVVVVDDASTDDSTQVIARYGGQVIGVLLPENVGQAAAMNAGFAACHGDVVLFLDADDWLFPRAAARAAAAFDPGVAQVQFRLQLVDSQGRAIDLLPAPEVSFDDGDVVPLLLDRGRYECNVTSGNAFSREALAAILPIPEEAFRISADGYLVTLAPLEGYVASVEEPLGAYVVHGRNGWTGNLKGGFAASLRRALAHDLNRYEALSDRAARLGLAVSQKPGLRDARHLTNRIGSLALEPDDHPFPADSLPGLALRGALASRYARLPLARRLLLGLWFLSLGVLPRAVTNPLVYWRLLPSSRPKALRAPIRSVRLLLRQI